MARRRQPSMLIWTFVVGLFMIGAVAGAIHIKSESEKYRMDVLEPQRKVLAEHEARLSVAEELLERTGELLGNNPGRYTDPAVMKMQVALVEEANALEVYDLAVDNADDSQLERLTRPDLPISTGGAPLLDPAAPEFDPTAFRIGAAPAINRRDVHESMTPVAEIADALALQGRAINTYLDANARLQRAGLAVAKARNDQETATAEAIAARAAQRDTAIDNKTREYIAALQQVDSTEVEFNRELQEFFVTKRDWQNDSDFAERRAELRRVLKSLIEQDYGLASTVELAEEVIDQLEKLLATRDHYDALIYKVDMTNGWVYINIGDRDLVSPGMNFEIVRYEPGRATPVPIASTTVTEVTGPFTARLDINQLYNASLPPREGDAVSSVSFSRVRPSSFCIVGEFGRPFTALTRAQLTDALTAAGYTVDPTVRITTQVLILGKNFEQDEQYLRVFDFDGDLYELRAGYATWAPRDVYRLLGIDY
jgi:hypothetical protein